jgi:hypothetical protein
VDYAIKSEFRFSGSFRMWRHCAGLLAKAIEQDRESD